MNSAKVVKGSRRRRCCFSQHGGCGGGPNVGGGVSHCSSHTVHVFPINKNIQLKNGNKTTEYN